MLRGSLTTTGALILALAALPMESEAQRSAATLSRGARVRVTAPGVNLQGHTLLFAGRDSGAIAFQKENQLENLVVPIAQITRLEVAHPHRPWASRGFVGLLAGGAVGAIAQRMIGGSCESAEMFDCFGTDLAAGLAFVGFTAGGLVTGVLHGMRPRERWTRVDP